MNEFKSIKEIQWYELGAQDGKIGRCSDFLFDERNWVVRYFVCDTHKWLPGRKVLISPISIGTVNEAQEILSVGLTKEQIKDSPVLERHAPVSREYEMIFNKYYDWGNYWDGSLAWGQHSFPRLLLRTEDLQEEVEAIENNNHLRSANEIFSYSIQATDTSIGHIEDFIVDKDTWIIRYLIVDTSNWLPGSRKVIISPEWVNSFDWGDGSVVVGVSAEQVEKSPEYDPSVTLDRDYETALYDSYGLPYYW